MCTVLLVTLINAFYMLLYTHWCCVDNRRVTESIWEADDWVTLVCVIPTPVSHSDLQRYVFLRWSDYCNTILSKDMTEPWMSYILLCLVGPKMVAYSFDFFLVCFGLPFSPYLASDLKTSWLFCVFLEQNLYCNSRLLWQMLSLPQPLFTKIICQKKQQSRNCYTLLIYSHTHRYICKALNSHSFSTDRQTHICTSETALFCW